MAKTRTTITVPTKWLKAPQIAVTDARSHTILNAHTYMYCAGPATRSAPLMDVVCCSRVRLCRTPSLLRCSHTTPLLTCLHSEPGRCELSPRGCGSGWEGTAGLAHWQRAAGWSQVVSTRRTGGVAVPAGRTRSRLANRTGTRNMYKQAPECTPQAENTTQGQQVHWSPNPGACGCFGPAVILYGNCMGAMGIQY